MGNGEWGMGIREWGMGNGDTIATIAIRAGITNTPAPKGKSKVKSQNSKHF
ncbi:MAG: hypothetical protein DSM106950_05620 [Stigonema ocellatum SAG 48.90 = DSM 106950]|nr:hypothetical protein [Stigonema ocellatum SAG 48.90 = DSM 106950]